MNVWWRLALSGATSAQTAVRIFETGLGSGFKGALSCTATSAQIIGVIVLQAVS
jgi:hypothetical protein